MGRREKVTKILIAAALYPPQMGGPATYAKMLAEELPKRGIEVVVLPFARVQHLPKIVRHIAYAFLLLRALRGVQLVYAMDAVSVGLPAYVMSVLCGKAFWVRLGGDYAWEQGQQRFGVSVSLDEYTKHKKDASWQVRALASVQAFVVRRAKKVIVPSMYMKRIVQTWGVTDIQLCVMYSAYEPLTVPLQKKDYRRKYHLHGPTVLSAGRLVPWKGFQGLIDVVAKLRDTYPNISLLIAGDGPQKAVLHQYIAEHDLSETVRLLGSLPRAVLGEYVLAADVFVLNTEYEGLSHQLLEVMALDTPVVTTDVGGNPELIEDGRSGYLVAYNDTEALCEKIDAILSNDALAAALTAHAREKAKSFSAQTTVDQLAVLISQQI